MLLAHPIPCPSLFLLHLPAGFHQLQAPVVLTQGRPQCRPQGWGVTASRGSPRADPGQRVGNSPASSPIEWNDSKARSTVFQSPSPRAHGNNCCPCSLLLVHPPFPDAPPHSPASPWDPLPVNLLPLPSCSQNLFLWELSLR